MDGSRIAVDDRFLPFMKKVPENRVTGNDLAERMEEYEKTE